MLGEERFERAVLGLEPDPAVAFAMEGLDGRLVGGLVFAAVQTLRADDELWVADDDADTKA